MFDAKDSVIILNKALIIFLLLLGVDKVGRPTGKELSAYLFGKRLRLLRESMGGINQSELGAMLGLKPYLVHRYEHGNNGNLPRPKTLKKIADFFGVSLEWLLSLADNLNEPLPVAPDHLAELKSRYYLTLALRCRSVPETKMPEAVEELERFTKLLVAWAKGKD